MITDDANTLIEAAPANQEQRSVSDLLKLDTYQGMTDAEVKSLIQWYVEQAVNGAELKASVAASIQAANAQAEAYRDAAEKATEDMRKVLAAPLSHSDIMEALKVKEDSGE